MKKISLILIFCLTLSCAKQVKVDMKILSYTGKVTVNSNAVTSINTVINHGDAIETIGESTCDIIINDKNVLRLKPDTKLTINLSDKESTLLLEKGWLAGVTRRAFTKEGKFLIKTPTVAAAVRGTSFCLKVENEKSTYFCTCNGSIELTGESSSRSETVEAAHHAARRFTIDKTGALIQDNNPGMLYHTDSGVEEIAKVIGETIDWSVPDKH
jgi:ferric-dicitrate binding protein FerR (iron transport regulator)